MELFDQLWWIVQLIVTCNVKMFHLLLCIKYVTIKQENYVLCAPAAFHSNRSITRKFVFFGNVISGII